MSMGFNSETRRSSWKYLPGSKKVNKQRKKEKQRKMENKKKNEKDKAIKAESTIDERISLYDS